MSLSLANQMPSFLSRGGAFSLAQMVPESLKKRWNSLSALWTEAWGS